MNVRFVHIFWPQKGGTIGIDPHTKCYRNQLLTFTCLSCHCIVTKSGFSGSWYFGKTNTNGRIYKYLRNQKSWLPYTSVVLNSIFFSATSNVRMELMTKQQFSFEINFSLFKRICEHQNNVIVFSVLYPIVIEFEWGQTGRLWHLFCDK